VVLVVVLAGGRGTHPLRAVFTAALQLRPGNEVRIAGRTVGDVQAVSLYDGEALVTMGIDEADWPLHAGTTAQLRFGAAASYASRYVQLQPGPARGPALADNALLPASDTITPVEFDQIFSTFDASTRSHLSGLISNASATLSGQSADIGRDLDQGAPGVRRTADFLSDLGLDPAALGTLVTAGASTFSVLRSNDSQLQGLVANAAQTFSVLADNATALGATVHRLPATLRESQRTLAHLDRSLNGLGALVSDLRPGATGLAVDAPLLRQVLAEILAVGPLAIETLEHGTQTLPRLTTFLNTAYPFAPTVTSALRSLAPMVACTRPYTPEIGAFLETWQGGPLDPVGHYGRVDFIQTPILPGTSDTSAQAIASSHGQLTYAFPRPPGLNAGKPWFQPQCGAGPDSLNPADDPEAGK
jgi:phospholipid/cholesterol/gamma-HCH transport system substrate-binding protein